MRSRAMNAAGLGLLIAGFIGMLRVDQVHDTLRAEVVTTTITWFLVAFAGYLVLMWAHANPVADSRWRWLLVVGLVLRLVLMTTTPTLSDDVYRYLWEGHLVTEGVSPYSFVIESPLGDAYDIEARSLANNTSFASPYLPVAHGLFGLSALVLPSEPWTMQLMMIGFDVLAVAMLIKLLRIARLPERRVLLYWLNPLAIIEVAHSAHIDAIILGLASAGLVSTFGRTASSTSSKIAMYAGPLLIAAATLTRPLAVLLLPVLFWVWNWRQRIVWAGATAIPIAIAGLSVGLGLGASSTGGGVFGATRSYTETFRFNSGPYHWMERWIAGRGLDDKGWNEPAALTRLMLIVIVASLMLAIFIAARQRTDARTQLRMLTLPLIVYVLWTPVLHPWYTLLLLGLLPFLAPGVDERRGRWFSVAPWVAMSGLLIFSYLTYEDPTAFGEREWVRRLEWYPTLGLCAVAVGWWLSQGVAKPSSAVRAAMFETESNGGRSPDRSSLK